MGTYNVNVSESDFADASKKKKNIGDLYDKLAELEVEYKSGTGADRLEDVDLPEELDLEKTDFEKKDEQTLRAQAEDSLRPKAEEELKQTEKRTEDSRAKLEKQLSDVQTQSEGKLLESAAKTEESVKQAESAALKRGLARSSVIGEQVRAIRESGAREQTGIRGQLLSDAEYIGGQIERAKTELEEARASFDVKLAAAAEEKLLKLIDEQEDKYLAAIKHNNDVEKKQADYKRQREAAENARARINAELIRNYNLYGAETDRREFMENKVTAVRNFFEDMPAADALKILETDDTIKRALGNYYILVKKDLQSRM